MQLTEGMAPAHGYWNMAMDTLVREHGAAWFMSGAVSSTVRSCIQKMEDIPENFRNDPRGDGILRYDYEDTLCSGFRDDELESILRPQIYRHTAGITYADLLRRFQGAPVESQRWKLDYLYLREFERHFISRNFEMFGGLAHTTTPFIDRDVHEFSYRTRTSCPLVKADWMEMLGKFFPSVASVPRTFTALPVHAPWPVVKAKKAYMRFYCKILPKLTGGHFGDYNYGAVVQYDQWLRTAMREWVTATLSREALLEDLVNMDTVRSVVANHMEGKTNDYSKLCILLNLAMWREQLAGM